MKPILSVITINYNNAAGIDRTISSVRSQTNVSIEYIVVDGGSTDGSIEIIQNNLDIINSWVSEADRGIYHAMNKGISMSNGSYLLFLNSGDEFKGTSILTEAVHQINGEELVSCNIVVVSATSENIKTYPDYPTFKYFLTDSLPHPATFIKKSLLDKTGGFNEKYKICSDWEFFLIALCKLNATHKHLSLILTRFYLGGISSSEDNKTLHLSERALILESHFARFKDLIYDMEVKNELENIINQSRLIKYARKAGMLNALDLVGKNKFPGSGK